MVWKERRRLHPGMYEPGLAVADVIWIMPLLVLALTMAWMVLE
jgi:hypothetical protein